MTGNRHQRARERPRLKAGAPKEQPPRKLSGTADRASLQTALWKAARRFVVEPTEGVSPPAVAPAGQSSQVP